MTTGRPRRRVDLLAADEERLRLEAGLAWLGPELARGTSPGYVRKLVRRFGLPTSQSAGPSS